MKEPQENAIYQPSQTKELISKTTWAANTYLPAATSDNTRKAYRSDIRHFEQWGGRLPATQVSIIRYLETYAPLLNPRTLARRLTALKQWHVYQQFPDPTAHPLIMKTMAGITRTHGRPKDKAPPLTPDELFSMAIHLQAQATLAAQRDNALLQIGFFGAFRRSELVALHVEHITWEKEGITILLPQSKTDQTHEGQHCAIPFGHGALCPVQALKNWLEKAGISEGPVFRRIYIKGHFDARGLSPLSVNHILQQRAKEVGIPHAADLSSHSLRRGLATSAARAGAPLQTIMRHGRWRQVNTVIEYIQASESFTENAAKSILLSRQENEKK
jgi:integrase